MPILSRREIPAKNPKHLIVVGWDWPIGTFFFQLLHAEEPDDPPIEWVGSRAGELSLERCLELVANYADVPNSLHAALSKDKEGLGFDPDRLARPLILPRRDERKRSR